jgi:hypothetical protein
LRWGAFATYCRRAYSSKFSGLCVSVCKAKEHGRWGIYVKPLNDDTCFRSANPICSSFSDGCGLRHSVSRSYGYVSICDPGLPSAHATRCRAQ